MQNRRFGNVIGLGGNIAAASFWMQAANLDANSVSALAVNNTATYETLVRKGSQTLSHGHSRSNCAVFLISHRAAGDLASSGRLLLETATLPPELTNFITCDRVMNSSALLTLLKLLNRLQTFPPDP